MKCVDCDDGLVPRVSLRLQASNLAQAITGGALTTEQQAGLGVYSLMLVGELAVRCKDCAAKRLMDGVDKILRSCEP